MDVMCGTCGQEVTARDVEDANRQHKDGAHEPSWYFEDKLIREW